jgi:isocitrate/isopropylmalate dehydrogenase
MKTVAVIKGEGAAPEAMDACVALLDAMGIDIGWVFPPVGNAAQASHGERFPAEARAQIDAADATFFGATSGASAGALFHLRWGRKTFANVRPVRWRPGFASPLARPQGVDLVIVRENLEDLYLFLEGDLEDLAPLDLTSGTAGAKVHELGAGRYAIKAITEAGSERVSRFAFELARQRRAAGHPGRVTASAKTNMLPQTDGLFVDTAERVSTDYPDIAFERFIVDDFAHRLVAKPETLDVVVLPNLYGDVLSDAAAALAGGLGIAPSACYGEDYAYFESAHGTAEDIAGRGIINPTASLLSASMMLAYLGLAEEARALETAIDVVYAEGRALTPDQGGKATTQSFCEAVLAAWSDRR